MPAKLLRIVWRILNWRVPKSRYERVGLYIQASFVVVLYGLMVVRPVYTGQSLATGYMIAALSVAAVVMAARTDALTTIEKAVWIVVCGACFCLELHFIDDDNAQRDRQHLIDMQAQRAEFNETLEGLQATVIELGSLTQATQSVAKLTRDNLESVTGGMSYAHLTPQVGYAPIPFSIYNDGPNILTGVSVNMRKGIVEADSPDMTGLFGQDFQVGILAPKQLKVLPFAITPKPGKSGLDVFIFQITAQNAPVEQRVYFRKSARGGFEWAFRYIVTRQYVASRSGKTTNFKYKILQETQWSDGSKDHTSIDPPK